MILAAILQQASLSDPQATSAIGAAMDWVSDLLFGPLATIIAVIAVAWVGFAMLSGRIDIRRGWAVLLGCFLLFGARSIAGGLQSATSNEVLSVAGTLPPPTSLQATTPNEPITNTGNVFDPYAGAAVIQK